MSDFISGAPQPGEDALIVLSSVFLFRHILPCGASSSAK
nr:MAG TPA: hypothetical protein [Caudoviricetes sp.]